MAPVALPVLRDRGRLALAWLPPRCSCLLDVGCAVGDYTAAFACRADRVIGVDVDREALARARARFPEVEFLALDGAALPVADAACDVLTALDVLEHIPEPARALAEWARVVRPGGTLLLSTPHAGLFGWLDPWDFRCRFPRLLGVLNRLAGRTSVSREPSAPHRHFTFGELRQLLEPAFRIERVARTSLVVYPVAIWWEILTQARAWEHSRVLTVLRRLSDWEYHVPFGPAAYNVMVKARRV